MGVRSARRPRPIAGAVSRILGPLPVLTAAALLDSESAIAAAPARAMLAAEIPAQPLAQALSAFARETGLQLVYISGVVSNRNSRTAAAGLPVDTALGRLLQGTGLRFEYLTPDTVRIFVPPPPRTSDADASGEIIVTANRREENLQDVPITIQVLTQATLEKLNATTLDDFVRYLPGVTVHGVGPGQNNIYIRGLGTTDSGIQGAALGTLPNVALYLDEQSAQLPSRNLDIYAADLERIEVLEGPQGTLFGAGAQAGVVRYITNKPHLDATEANANSGYAVTAHGAPSTALDATLNLPLIPDRLAVRAVIYDEKRGGYIDNIPATFARSNSDVSIAYAGGNVPANSVVINNAALVANNINPVTYQGTRIEALFKIDADWSVLIAQSYQRTEADGVFAEEAASTNGQPQPDLTVQLFNPSYDKDSFENTALTVEGRLAALHVLYAGSYLLRKVDQVGDYTTYAHGGLYADYYQCVAGPTPQCFSPSSTWHDQERNAHQSHELRVSTPDDWQLRGVGGLFYENYAQHTEMDFYYLTALPYFNPIAPPTEYWAVNGSPTLPNGEVICGCTPGAVLLPGGVTSNNPNVRPAGDAFFNDITHGYNQKAAYTSFDYDLIPGTLTVTAGTRYFSTNTWEVGSTVSSFGCSTFYNPPASVPNPCINREFLNLNVLGLSRTFTGFRSRANLSWRIRDDALLYYTWAQGFRPGGFNRGFTPPFNSPLSPGSFPWQTQADLHGGWFAPRGYAPDTLTSNELGWKTTWWNQLLQWNGAVYQEDWSHAQVSDFDTPVLNSSVMNGGDYRVRGLEMSLSAHLVAGVTFESGGAWNHSALVRQPTFYWEDGTPIDFTTLRSATGAQLSNPVGPLGSPLAGAPPFQGYVRLRYEIPLDAYAAFAQIGAVHQSHSIASTDWFETDLQGNSLAYDLPPFTTYDAALGAGKDAWLVQLYAENLTDTRAELYENARQYYRAITVNRPRTLGLRFSYKFRG